MRLLRRSRTLLLLFLVLAPLIGCAQERDSSSQATTDTTADTTSTELPEVEVSPAESESDVPFVESPQPVVDSMLTLADVSEDDVVYDLGSGDGRFPITAARTYGARGVGIEIQSDLVEKARANAEDAGVADRVDFREGDLFDADISDATVVTLYLLPDVNLKLRSKLFRELEPGTRVVSHDFDMDEWSPDTSIDVDGNRLFLWTIPEETPDFVDLDRDGGSSQ
ncbi:MAG: methyltransferase domain-containing protein [Salinibacter sp.]